MKYFIPFLLLVVAHCMQNDSDTCGTALVQAETIDVATTAEGQVAAVYPSEGDAVDSGTLLAVLDTTALLLQEQEVLARQNEMSQRIAAQQSRIAATEAQARGLAREFGRIGQLADKGSVPEQKKDDLGTQVQVMNHTVKAEENTRTGLTEQKKILDIQRQKIRDQIRRCYVYAPAQGVVAERFTNPGEVLRSGETILTLAIPDRLFAQWHATPDLCAQTVVGQKVRLSGTAPGGESFTCTARVTRIYEASMGDGNTNRFRVRAAIDSCGDVSLRGMAVSISPPQ